MESTITIVAMIPVIFQLVIHSPFDRIRLLGFQYPISAIPWCISIERIVSRYLILDAVQNFRTIPIALSSIENPVSRIEYQTFCPGYVTCSFLNSLRFRCTPISTFTTLFSIKTWNVSSARGAGALMTFPAMSNAEA